MKNEYHKFNHESDLALVRAAMRGLIGEGIAREIGRSEQSVRQRMAKKLKLAIKDIRQMNREGKSAQQILETSPLYAPKAMPVAKLAVGGGNMLDLEAIRLVFREEIQRAFSN